LSVEDRSRKKRRKKGLAVAGCAKCSRKRGGIEIRRRERAQGQRKQMLGGKRDFTLPTNATWEGRDILGFWKNQENRNYSNGKITGEKKRKRSYSSTR